MSCRAVLFDLDDTLFDHNHATSRATATLRDTEPAFAVWSPDELRRRHSEVLEIVHREVISGRMAIDEARRERFRRLLADAGGDDAALGRAGDLAAWYRRAYEQNWRAVHGAVELLQALKARGLAVVIVTNNLTAEQEMKLRHCAMTEYVDALITSESAGSAKPDPRIFETALEAVRVSRTEAVMVGDAWDTDIAGALEAGVRPIWFNWRRMHARAVNVDQLRSLAPVEQALRTIAG